MGKIKQSKILKSIFLIVLMSIFQPFLDLLLVFQYGPSAVSIESFILEQTLFISLLYIALPLIILYLLFKISNLNSLIIYAIIGFLFAFLSFSNITLFLFSDRIAAWSTYSEEEILNNALLMAFPTLLIQIVVITKILHKINLKKTLVVKTSEL